MKKYLCAIFLSVSSTLALAAGADSPGHGLGSHDMSSHSMAAMPTMPASLGHPGDPAKVDRTVEIVMSDAMRFEPAHIEVKAGETIRFFVKNSGKLTHEMVIGSMNTLKEHARQMRSMPGMVHSEPNTLTLKPGQRGGIVWTFSEAGMVEFACLVPGHLEAGMSGAVRVN